MATNCRLRLTSEEHARLKVLCPYFCACDDFLFGKQQANRETLDFTVPFEISKCTLIRMIMFCVNYEGRIEAFLQEDFYELFQILDFFGADKIFDDFVRYVYKELGNCAMMCQCIRALYLNLEDHPWVTTALEYLQQCLGLELSIVDIREMSYRELCKVVTKQKRCAAYASKVNTFYCGPCGQAIVYRLKSEIGHEYNTCKLAPCCATKIHLNEACMTAYVSQGLCTFCDCPLLPNGDVDKDWRCLHTAIKMYLLRDKHGFGRDIILPPLYKYNCDMIK